MNMYQKYTPYCEPFIYIPIDGRLYNSLQDYGLPFNPFDDHGIPVRPVPGVLYDSLQDHGIPENPIPGRVYLPFHIFPILP